MKRILIITRNFPPLVGGMERLVFNIYKQLAKHYDCDVVGPPGSGASVQDNHQSYACRLHPVPIFILSAIFKGLRASSSRKYGICIAGSGLTAPVAVIVSTIRGLKSITFIHGLDLIVRSRIYQLIFIPFIRRSDIVVANSRNTARLAEQAGIPTERIVILHPGVDMPDESQTIEGFRKRYNLEGKSLLLSAGRLIPRKGLAEFIRYALPAVARNHRDTVLVIVGSEPENALNRTDSVLNDIQSGIKEHSLEEHVLMTGRIDDNSLRAAYEEADCFIFPSREVPGDVEGFGMVAVEAAAHGLPTVAFAEGGVSDAVAEGESGFLVTPGDYEGFSRTLIKYLDDPDVMPSPASCRAFAERFNWDRFGDRLLHIINSTPAQTSLDAE
jgi:phosphatidylinositol alpha-1,6-mannosyltransferase